MIEPIIDKKIIESTTSGKNKKRISKDEMNLVELPFALLANRAPVGLKTIKREWEGVDENGKKKKFYKIITGSDKWGLPTFSGEELYLACMEVSYNSGFKNRKVPTTQYELLKLLGWGVSGKSYERLIKTFNQLGGVFISTNAFWDKEEKRYKKTGFGIIDDYMFDENETKRKKALGLDQLQLPFSNFRWNELFFENCIQKGNIKTIDPLIYFSLSTATAKRLYRFVDKKLYFGHTSEIDLFRLAFEKLEMIGKYKYPSKVIEKLSPAIKELGEKGIAKISIKPSSSTQSGYKVCIDSYKKSFIFPPAKNIQAEELVQYFHTKMGRQTTENSVKDKELKQAENLLKLHSEKQCKEFVDFAISEGNKTNFDMQYFGAVLLYVTKALDKERAAKKNEKNRVLEEKEKDFETQYEVYKSNLVSSFIARLPKEDLEAELKRIGEKMCKDNPINAKWGKVIFKEIVLSAYHQELLDNKKVKVLDFIEWKNNNKHVF